MEEEFALHSHGAAETWNVESESETRADIGEFARSSYWPSWIPSFRRIREIGTKKSLSKSVPYRL